MPNGITKSSEGTYYIKKGEVPPGTCWFCFKQLKCRIVKDDAGNFTGRVTPTKDINLPCVTYLTEIEKRKIK